MNKAKLIEELSMLNDFESKAAASRAVEFMIDIIQETLAKGEVVDISGLGKFYPKTLPPKEGIACGNPYSLPERTVPKFRPALKFKRAVA